MPVYKITAISSECSYTSHGVWSDDAAAQEAMDRMYPADPDGQIARNFEMVSPCDQDLNDVIDDFERSQDGRWNDDWDDE